MIILYMTARSIKGIAAIRSIVERDAEKLYRPMPWRYTNDPYQVLVSEIMLQQTQVGRVLEKYPVFIERFPTTEALVSAPTSVVIGAWQGLGYNRRALFLKKCAEAIVSDHHGVVPCRAEELRALPGIGAATAGAVLAYAYDMPTIFIETNIRRVFIFYCFGGHEGEEREVSKKIDDKEIVPLVRRALPASDYRRWYYALTDLGAALRNRVGHNPNLNSHAYRAQSKFDGSLRQVRGAILRRLSAQNLLVVEELPQQLPYPEAQMTTALHALEKEGFIVCERERIYLKE